jgi:hypothetical protein
VMELIDQDTKWWNSKLIHDNLFEDEACTICQIPLSPRQVRILQSGKVNLMGNFQ